MADRQKNQSNTSNKRSLPLEDSGDNGKKRHRKEGQKFIDLSDVPDQLPILKNRKNGSSKYQGVYFDKRNKKWQAKILFDGNSHSIGYYGNEEEAAKDYARAVYKYRGGKSAVERLRHHKRQKLIIDLSDVPEQLPIPKNRENGSSKYQGVYFDKRNKKWQATIVFDGKKHHIGLYENEEEAAKDYARAVYKYRGEKSDVEGQQKLIGTVTDREI